jgi:hypothetical protein
MNTTHEPRRIAIGKESEVRYWAGKFGVSREELVAAVRTVGASPTEVLAFLRRDRRH